MARQALIILVVVIAFGILVPIYKGFGFLDPRIIAGLCLFGAAVRRTGERRTGGCMSARASGILGRIAIIVAWGWGITVLILGTAIVTLNVADRATEGSSRLPSEFLAAVLVFSLSASDCNRDAGRGSGAPIFGRGCEDHSANRRSSSILLALAFGSRVLPENVTLAIFDRFSTRRALTHLAWEASAVCAAIAALFLLVVLIKSHHRARLHRGLFAKIPMAENPDEGGG